MADVQPDKFFRFSNMLADEMAKRHFPGNEWQIMMLVWRKTWGFNKKTDRISISQLAEGTGLSRPRAAEALSSLVRKSVLVHIRKSGLVNEIGFQKDFDLWTSPEKRICIPIRKSVRTSPEKRNSASGSTSPEKRIHNIHKDILQKTAADAAAFTAQEEMFFQKLLDTYNAENDSRLRKMQEKTKRNVQYWLEIRSEDDILEGISNQSKCHNDFFDTLELDALFRRSNKSGDPVDYIGNIIKLSNKHNRFS